MPPQLRSRQDGHKTPECVGEDLLAVEDLVRPARHIPVMVVREVVLPTPSKEKRSRKAKSSVKDLPKNKVIVQDPSSRKGGGPAWTPVQYEDAIKLQEIWNKNRWCLEKIRNEFVGDKMLSEAGDEAKNVIAYREKVLEAYTILVRDFLAAQTEMGPNGLEVIGAKFAYSKITAIIGAEEAKRLKEAHARVVTQVCTRKDSWYACLSPVNIARAVSQAREAESDRTPGSA